MIQFEKKKKNLTGRRDVANRETVDFKKMKFVFTVKK